MVTLFRKDWSKLNTVVRKDVEKTNNHQVRKVIAMLGFHDIRPLINEADQPAASDTGNTSEAMERIVFEWAFGRKPDDEQEYEVHSVKGMGALRYLAEYGVAEATVQ